MNLTNGVTVPVGANVLLSSASTANISKNAGNFTVNGTIDITDRTITNTSGSVIVNGILKTSRTTGLYNPGNIASGTLILNNGSTVDYNNANSSTQFITGTLSYYNITFSGSGVKSPLSTISVNSLGTVKITGSCFVDGLNWNIASTGANSTNFLMDGGRFAIGTGGTQPNMDGSYSISGGVIEFHGTSAKTIRNKAYQNIEIVGSNVSTSNGPIELNDMGTFRIRSGGTFISTNLNASIIGPTGTQTFTMESNSTFRCAIESGFYGPGAAFGDPSPSVRDNIENIVLNTGSTIEYARESGVLPGSASSGNQVITIPFSGGNPIPYQNLVIGGNGTKTAPSGTLAIQGNLTKSINSTFQNNDGLVLLNGTTQSFAGLDFYGLELTGGTKTTNGNASIEDVLKINSNAVLNITANQAITLRSNATKTARVDELLHANPRNAITYNTTGKFIVERYLLNSRKWRLLSAPTDSLPQTVRSSWQENGATPGGYGATLLSTFYTAGNPNGYDGLGTNNSILTWNGASGGSWNALPNTNTPIKSRQGYMVFVASDRTSNPFPLSTPTTLRTSGPLYVGTQPTVDVMADEYEIIGNPYASRIDIRNITFTGDGTEQSIAVWDPSLTTGSAFGLGAWNYLFRPNPLINEYVNQFTSAVYGAAGTSNNYIESGMAFLVRSTGVNGSVTISEATKDAGSNSASFTSGASQLIKVNLQSTNGTLLDGVSAQYDSALSNAIEAYDIHKMRTFGEGVALKSSDSLLVIERRANIVEKDTLHLTISRMKVQSYQWEIVTDNMDYPTRTGFLIDRYLNTSTPLNMAGTTSINFSIQNIPASYAADRFKIVFNQVAAGPLPVTFTTVTANRNADKTVAIQWKVEQELNIESYEVERSSNGTNFIAIHSRTASGNNNSSMIYDHVDLLPLATTNFYRIKATSIGGQVQYSNIVKLNGTNVESNISVYPNPVVDKKLQIRFQNQENGKYQVQLFNVKGQLMFSKTIIVSSAAQADNLQLPTTLVAGSYQLQVKNANGRVTQQTIVIQ